MLSKVKEAFFYAVKDTIKSDTYSKILVIFKSFIMGFLFSKASVFNSVSPFGVGFIGAVNQKEFSIFSSLCGVFLGYLTQGTIAISHILCSLAVFALRLLTKNNTFSKKEIFYAFSSGIMLFVAGIINAVQFNFVVYDILLTFALSVLCIAFIYFFNKSSVFFADYKFRASGLSQKELISVVVILSVLMLSLNSITFLGFSMGRVLGIFIVLTASLYGGIASGSISGVIVGMIMSFSVQNSTGIIGAFAFDGLLGGCFFDLGKLAVCIAFLLSNSVLSMYFNGINNISVNIYEIVFTCLVFILMPEKMIKKTANFLLLHNDNGKKHPQKFKELFLNRLKMASSSFNSLAEIIKHSEILKKNTPNAKNNIVCIAADTICKKCRCSMFCWGTAYNDTMNVLNDLTTVFNQKGKIEIDDVPNYFSSRCEKTPQLIAELNLQLAQYWAYEKQETKLEENRIILAEQYNGVSQIINNIANDLGNAIRFDTLAEERVIAYLEKHKIKNPNVSCYTDADGLFNVEANALLPVNIEPLQLLAKEIGVIVGYELDISFVSEDSGMWQCKLSEKEEYSLFCARASFGKDGKAICGDSSSSFRADGGKYIMTISDGMGSGSQAQTDSLLTVTFFEKLLKAGFDKESAFKLVNTALILKSKDESFATVDITVISLVNGIAEFIKAGAAPTFVKRGTSVYELGCSSLPAGILAEAKIEKSKCKLKENDMIIMASDGITSVGSKLITKLASTYTGDSPQELAQLLLNEAKKITTADDMTVAVGLFCRK